MHMFGEYGWGMGILGMIAMVLFWVIVIAGAFYLLKLLIQPGNPETTHRETPEEILKKRFARGEIGKEELERMMKELKG